MTRLFLCLFLVISGIACGQSDMKTIAGSVVYEDGSPVHGVEIAPKWKYSDYKKEYSVQNPEKNGHGVSDSEGTFEMQMMAKWWEGILAYDEARNYGAVGTVRRADAPLDLKLTVKPLAKVTGKVIAASDTVNLKRSNLGIYHLPEGKPTYGMILSLSTVAPDFLLPPGNYRIKGTAGTKMGRFEKEFTVPEGATEVDLGTMEIPLQKWASLAGKDAPALEFSHVRGLPENTNWESLRGKWVMLVFWGHWCGPCHREMDGIISFYNRHPGLRDKFEIIAVHSPDAKDFKVVDEAMGARYRKNPAGRQISFPVVLDAESKINQSYGVQMYPTDILVDPSGKIVTRAGGPHAFEELKQRLGAK